MTASNAARSNLDVDSRSTPSAAMPAITTVAAVIDRLAARADQPTIVAITPSGSRTITCGELHHEVRRLAAALTSGDTVALFGPDTPEWIVAELAAVRAGGVAMPVGATDENLAHAFADSGARLVFTTSDRLPQVRRASPHCEVVLLDTPVADRCSLTAVFNVWWKRTDASRTGRGADCHHPALLREML